MNTETTFINYLLLFLKLTGWWRQWLVIVPTRSFNAINSGLNDVVFSTFAAQKSQPNGFIM